MLSGIQLCDPVDYTVHGILQARILEWVAFSRGSSKPRDWTQVSHIAGEFFTSWATREASLIKIKKKKNQGLGKCALFSYPWTIGLYFLKAFIFYFSLNKNCFTILFWFLLHNKSGIIMHVVWALIQKIKKLKTIDLKTPDMIWGWWIVRGWKGLRPEWMCLYGNG